MVALTPVQEIPELHLKMSVLGGGEGMGSNHGAPKGCYQIPTSTKVS